MFRPLFVLLVVFLTLLFAPINSHNESGEWSCESSESGTQIAAEFRPGVVTLDGHPDDWKDIGGFDFSLLPALDPHEDDAYKGGKMTVKVYPDSKFSLFFNFILSLMVYALWVLVNFWVCLINLVFDVKLGFF